MATIQWLKVFWIPLLLAGCASFPGGRNVGSDAAGREPPLQFVAQVFASGVRQGDQEIQFFEEHLTLNRRELLISSGGNRAAQSSGQRVMSISRIKSAALYPGGVTHPNQLQLLHEKELVLLQVLGTHRTSDDRRTQQLYELLVANGVARGRADQFYYAGMDLTKRKASPQSGNSFSAAAGARVGEFIWDSIKGFGKLLIKPFIPLF